MTSRLSHLPFWLLRATVRLARWVWWAIWAVLALMVLTLAVLHGVIVPRIADWKDTLEAKATQAAGVPVRLGGIEAQSVGWIPTITFNDVQLLNAQGMPTLQLGRVVTVVSPSSLWRLGFEHITIENPQVQVRRRADGQLEVAGIPISTTPDAHSNRAADWFFSQTEFSLRSGTLHWLDETQTQPAKLTLTGVDILVRNQGRKHQWRLQATPPEGMAGQVTLMGDFRTPFFSLHPGRFSEWSGQAYIDWPQVDLAKLSGPWLPMDRMGLKVSQGQGAMRVWADVRKGQLTATVADLALHHLHAAFKQAAHPLELSRMAGRISLSQRDASWEVQTEQLSFETADGLQWHNGNLRVRHQPVQAPATAPGELEARHIDLAALRELVGSLPLPPQAQAHVVSLQPSGTLDHLQLKWQGNEEGWPQYSAKGTVVDLSLEPHEAPLKDDGKPNVGRPGFSGAQVEFELSQAGGQARLSMNNGHITFPGVFEEPRIPLDHLLAQVNWSLQGEHIQVEVPQAQFSNPDLHGQTKATWKTQATAADGHRFPGHLSLDGQLTQGKGNRVHRYLPLVIAADARHYVRDAILSGEARDVRFHVNGPLNHLPFDRTQDGDFRIATQVSKVDFAFVPPGMQPNGSLPWPSLRQLDGELIFDKASMRLNVTKGTVTDLPNLKVSKATATIANLSSQAVVEVQAQIDGPLADTLELVRKSPLADMTGKALNAATGSGAVGVQFGLSLPVTKVSQTAVKGSIQLQGNEVQWSPDLPPMSRVKGSVDFTDKGFALNGLAGRWLGGDVQASGGLKPNDSQAQLRFAGTTTPEGLRSASFLGPVTPWIERATGQTTYTAQLDVGRSGVPEITVQSNLQGLGLSLPEPLNKPAATAWPLRFTSRIQSQSPTLVEQWQLDILKGDAPLLAAQLQREHANGSPRPSRGGLWLGIAPKQGVSLPSQGFVAQLAWPQVDVDAWEAHWNSWATPKTTAAPGPGSGANVMDTLLPDRLVVDTPLLHAMGHRFNEVKLVASRRGDRWSGQVQAKELNGQFEFLPTQNNSTASRPASIQARLNRLKLQTADTPVLPGGSPLPPLPVESAQLPSIDLSVAEFELDRKALGSLELQATNRLVNGDQREWRLTRLQVKTPEATLNASGNWAPLARSEQVNTTTKASATISRRTALNLTLDVSDAGQLLGRLGMPDVFKGGKGQLKGTLAWLGAPHAMHTPSMTGQLHLDVSNGQFLKADPGLAKLLGVLSLQSLPRRLTLDFRDVFSQGFAFDFVRGDARIEEGVAHTNNLQMKGPTAAVLLEGKADVVQETQDLRVVVVPELNAGTASLIATVINPAVGLGSFLAQALLRQPLIQASTQNFRIQGTWTDPVVDRIPGANASAPSPAQAP